MPLITRRSVLLGAAATGLLADEAQALSPELAKRFAEQREAYLRWRESVGLAPPLPPTPRPPPPPQYQPPPTESGYRPKHPPEATRTLLVPENYSLAAATKVAVPGDHISLANGIYPGNLSLDRWGTHEQPIVIRSRNPLGATISGQLTIKGSHHWLYELRTSWNAADLNRGAAINLRGSYVTITRCVLASNHAISCDRNGRHHIWIGWNRFSGQNRTQQALKHIYFDQPPGRAWTVPTKGPNNIWIYRNLFWDAIGAGLEDHCIYFGPSKALGGDIGCMLNVSIEYNLFHRNMKRTRSVYVKRACDLLYNQMDCPGNFTVRHGWGSRCWGNRLGPAHFSFNGGRPGQGHDIRGNSCNRPLLLHCGSYSPGDNLFQAADYATVVGNDVPAVVVGYMAAGHRVAPAEGAPINNVRVYLAGFNPVVIRRAGLCDLATCLAGIASDGGLDIPETISLSQSDVGLEAPNQVPG